MQHAAPSILLIVRHAHSSWAQPGQRDHQRPLDERGRREAPRVGKAIASHAFSVDLILCSTAVRALETLDGIRPHLVAGIAEQLLDDLYALECDAYYAHLREARDASCVLIVGHNPMIEELAVSLAGSGGAKAMESLRAGFGTAGMAVVELPDGFRSIAPGKGHLRAMILPS